MSPRLTPSAEREPQAEILPRDPEDRHPHNEEEVKDKMLDKTIADSFPASDPPSSLPDPDEDSFAEESAR